MADAPSAPARAELLELLVTRAYAKRRVVLASGRESDFFVDCKDVVLGARGHRLVGEIMLAALEGPLSCDAVAGVELGGCPLASAVSLTSALVGCERDAVYVRKAAKDHGSARLLEGAARLPKGARVTLLEDVTTTGGSSLRAAKHLRDAGYVVPGIVSLVDREEGGRAAIESEGLAFRAIFTRADFPA